MEENQVVTCPFHGTPLKIGKETITVNELQVELITGTCPNCNIIYVDKNLRIHKKAKKGSFIYNGIVYQYIPRMCQQKTSSITEIKVSSTSSIKSKEEHRAPLVKESSVVSQSPVTKTVQSQFNVSNSTFIDSSPKQIYVVSTFELEKCPVCSKKTTFVPKKLILGKEDRSIIMGYECFKCHTPFILEKMAEKYFLEDYIDELNLDFLEVSPLKQKGIAELQKNISKTPKKKSIRALDNITLSVTKPLTTCRIHDCKLKKYRLLLTDGESKVNCYIGGCYCKNCKKIYISHKMEDKIATTFEKTAVNLHNLKLTCIGKEWENMVPIQVLKIESENDKKEEIAVKENPRVSILDDDIIKKHISLPIKELPTEKRFKTEIAVISAVYNKKEVLIYIVRRLEKGKNTAGNPDEICVRSLSLLGRELLGRIAHKELVEFSTEKETVKIHKFKVWPDEEYNLYGFKKFTDVDKVQTITILNQKNLPSESDDYETVTALIYCAGRDLPVYIDVYYSKLNDEYFINSDSYELYTKRYGLPYVRIISDEYNGSFGYDDLRQQSELSLYGYSVGKNSGLTSGGRKKLLQQLLDNHFMTKSQIINHLEWLINTHKYRESMRDACDCWKEDLMFVHQCKINTQRAVWGKFAYKGTVLK